MKLPNPDRLHIPQTKITEYLLSFSHSQGRSKAEFFTRFGFRRVRWEELAAALVRHGTENDVSHTEDSPFGIRYIVLGPFKVPSGQAPLICTVWFVENGDSTPRLVTAYPMKKRNK